MSIRPLSPDGMLTLISKQYLQTVSEAILPQTHEITVYRDAKRRVSSRFVASSTFHSQVD